MINDDIVKLIVLDTKFKAEVNMSQTEWRDYLVLVTPEGGIPLHTMKRVTRIVSDVLGIKG